MGLLIIAFSVPFAWMNERRQVKLHSVLKASSEGVVRNVDADQVQDEKSLCLVHTTACTSTEIHLTDDQFNVSLDQTMQLRRVVEMF